MIKKPMNFAIGIFCGCCFAICIYLDRGGFPLVISAIATALNITIGLTG